MAITNFIPEVWASEILSIMRSTLVYAQAGIINRDYEGEISQAGDTVHITSFEDPTVKDYTRNGSIEWDLLTDATLPFTITQSKYFAFKVDDLDKRQALSGFVEEASRGASYGLASNTDAYVAAQMAAGVDASNQLGTVALAVATPAGAYDMLVDLRTRLTRSNVPSAGRFVVVPPEVYSVLLRDDRFIRVDQSGTSEGLRNGQVGRAAGFDVIEANDVPQVAGPPVAYTVLAGHAMATTFADQISKTEAVRLQDTFADGVKGLHVFDAKVVRPTALASASVTVA